jgi:hypothetical protein
MRQTPISVAPGVGLRADVDDDEHVVVVVVDVLDVCVGLTRLS